MEKLELLEKQKFIFGSLFLLANKLQVIIDKGLAGDDLTTKQWFLMAVMGEFFENNPTLSEVAEAMGSSHQNVKQIALKLQQKGFLDIKKDEQDRRAIRLNLTEKCHSFWEKRQDEDLQFLTDFFAELSEAEINAMFNGFKKLIEKVAELE